MTLDQCIYEGGDTGGLGKNENEGKQKQDDDKWDEEPQLSFPQKEKQIPRLTAP